MNDNTLPATFDADGQSLGTPKLGAFVTLNFQVEPETGQLDVGIIKVPIDLRIIEDFQTRFKDELAAENLKFVIYKDVAYLTPVTQSSLIVPR